MTIRKSAIVLLLVAIVIVFQQCSKSDSGSVTTPTTTDPQPILPATAFTYNMVYPAHIQNALV